MKCAEKAALREGIPYGFDFTTRAYFHYMSFGSLSHSASVCMDLDKKMHILLTCYITCDFSTYVQKLHSRKYQIKIIYYLLKGNYLFLGSVFHEIYFPEGKNFKIAFSFHYIHEILPPSLFVISLKHTFCHVFFTR